MKDIEVRNSLDVLRDTRFKWENNDCVVRALAIAADIDYSLAHKWAKQCLQREDGKGVYGTIPKMNLLAQNNLTILSKSIKSAGKMINKDYTQKPVQYTVGTFPRKFNKGRFLVIVRGHALAVVDGVVYDNNMFKETGFRRPIRAAFQIT
jgi:hypothetical protein